MSKEHYNLLTLKNGELTGPLASVVKAEDYPRDFQTITLFALSRFHPRGINLLGIDVGLDENGQFLAEPTGLLAKGMGQKMADNITTSIRKKGEPLLRRDAQLIYTLFQPPIPSEPMTKVLASRLQTERTGRPFPATHTMQITTACQCDCVHCSAVRFRNPENKQLTTDEAKSFIRQSLELGVVNMIFTGGEPLLRSDLFELISAVDKKEAIAMIFTNGLLLTKENVQKLVDAGLFSLMVSLDSPEPQEHNTMRCTEKCWEKAVEGIRRCLDAGLLCGISTYATPERVRNGKVVEMIELGRRLGVHEITIFDVVPTGRLLRHEEGELLTDADKQEICRMEDDYNARKGYPHIVTQAHVNGPSGGGCYAAWFQLYSTAYGDITPCDFTPLTFGNIRNEPLKAIWERMTSHPSYCTRLDHCRMQDHAFRKRWIDDIPTKGPFPFPIERFDAADFVREVEEEVEQRTSIGLRA